MQRIAAAPLRRFFAKSYAFKIICPYAGQAVLLKQKNQNSGSSVAPGPCTSLRRRCLRCYLKKHPKSLARARSARPSPTACLRTCRFFRTRRWYKLLFAPFGSDMRVSELCSKRPIKSLCVGYVRTLRNTCTGIGVANSFVGALCPAAGSVKKAFSRHFFAIKKWRSGAAAIRCIRLLKAKPLNQNADRV
mgnify:CR=1 FL=1